MAGQRQGPSGTSWRSCCCTTRCSTLATVMECCIPLRALLLHAHLLHLLHLQHLRYVHHVPPSAPLKQSICSTPRTLPTHTRLIRFIRLMLHVLHVLRASIEDAPTCHWRSPSLYAPLCPPSFSLPSSVILLATLSFFGKFLSASYFHFISTSISHSFL